MCTPAASQTGGKCAQQPEQLHEDTLCLWCGIRANNRKFFMRGKFFSLIVPKLPRGTHEVEIFSEVPRGTHEG